jgi:hypothetical protein
MDLQLQTVSPVPLHYTITITNVLQVVPLEPLYPARLVHLVIPAVQLVPHQHFV